MRFLELHPYENADLAGGKVLVFDCPCGDGSRIRLPVGATELMTDQKKQWAYEGSGDHVTLRPSVDLRGGGHRCHFNVTNGEVFQVP